MMTLTIPCPTPAATEAVGRRLGALLFPGAVIALIGPLGAGKTFFSRSLAEGLQIPSPRDVTSPTFVLIQEYTARLPIYHFDAYRLKHLSEFEDLGALDYFAGEGVCLVEWADRIAPLLPRDHLRVELDVTGESSRVMTLTGYGARYEEVLVAVG